MNKYFLSKPNSPECFCFHRTTLQKQNTFKLFLKMVMYYCSPTHQENINHIWKSEWAVELLGVRRVMFLLVFNNF